MNSQGSILVNLDYGTKQKMEILRKRPRERLIEEVEDEFDETASESDESLHHTKEVKTIEAKIKLYTATVKYNGIRKEFIIDTGSPITFLSSDEKILKTTEI